MPTRLCAVAAILLPVSASGCCTISLGLASLFCGPRQDPWVQISYQTPRDALETFIGAVARDDVDTICRTLSYEFKAQQRIATIECDIAWEMLKEQIPGIHLLDQAEISGPTELPGQRVGYTLSIAGSQMQLQFAQQAYWEVMQANTSEVIRGDFRGADLTEHGAVVDAIDDHLNVDPGPGGTALVSQIQLFIPVPAEEILSATVGREWKLQALAADVN